MYLVPALGDVLLAASFTVRDDMDRLDRWMLELDHTPVPADRAEQGAGSP